MAIDSYENFLRVQWFCESKQIKLINLTFKDIMHYPKVNILSKDYYRNIIPLYEMIDFNKWVFWKETSGLFEYTRDNNLPFGPDNIHPATLAHKHFVEHFLLPKIT
jgi:hypothetical protein